MARTAPAVSLRIALTVLVVVALVGLGGILSASAPSTARASAVDLPAVGTHWAVLDRPVAVTIANPYSNGMSAALAVGQADLVSGSAGGGARNLSEPLTAVTFDSTGDLWLADMDNNRVLEYLPPFSTGMAASLVIGQTSLSGSLSNTTASGLWEPAGIAFDRAGDLWVADSTNNRVLEYTPPFSTGMSASLVLGQSNFVSRSFGTSASAFTHPTGILFNGSGALFVADSVNNRVLAFDPPFSNGMSASLVLGQGTFATSGAGTTATNLSDPTDIAIDSAGGVWVADRQNDRVVGFAAPLSNGMAASAVLGEPNLVTRSPSAPYGLVNPTGLAFDAAGDLWVADSGNNRVVEYLGPISTTESPSAVEGQTGFAGTAGGTTAVNLSGPTMPAVDPSGDLWVEDTGNNRVVEYVPTSFAVTASESGLIGGTTWSVTFNGVLKTAVAPANISFTVWNGSYPYSAGTVSGYTASPTSGTEPVNGAATGFTITYSASSTSSGGTTLGGSSWWWIILILVVVVLLILLYVQRRRRKRAAPPAPPLSAGAPPNPPASGSS